MAIFDKLNFGNKEEKQQMAAENRERDFINKRDVFQSALIGEETQMAQQEARSDLIRWQQELDGELMETVYTLLGLEVRDGNVYQVGDPMCNNAFVREVVIPSCKPFMSRNLINSNLEEKRILANQKNTIHEVIDVMSDNYDKYEIDFKQYDNILRLIKNVIEPGPYRALKGFTKRQDNTMTKRVETLQDQQEKRPVGLLGGIRNG